MTNRSFSHDVAAAIFVYRKKNILWELNSFHMLDFFLFQAICKAADHVTKNDLYPGKIMDHDQFESMTDLWRTCVPCCNSWDIKKNFEDP